MSRRPKVAKKDCVGCRQNFYNGNNELGIQTCWNLPTATWVKVQEVPMSQPPPYRQPVEYKPSCYRMPGFAYIEARLR